jgi:hypothetical protein
MTDYRQLHLATLRSDRRVIYCHLKQSGQVDVYLYDVVASASTQFKFVREQFAQKNPYNPVEWTNSRSAYETGWTTRPRSWCSTTACGSRRQTRRARHNAAFGLDR